MGGGALDGGSNRRRRGVLDADGHLHAVVAEALAADEIVMASDVKRNHVSSGSSGPVVAWMIGVAGLVVGLVHLQHVHLVPVVHKNCKNRV